MIGIDDEEQSLSLQLELTIQGVLILHDEGDIHPGLTGLGQERNHLPVLFRSLGPVAGIEEQVDLIKEDLNEVPAEAEWNVPVPVLIIARIDSN